jgi:protein phosphatase
MLVCPHCQFENPDTNNFCQNCGKSLTDDQTYLLDAGLTPAPQPCSPGSTMTETRWQAILSLAPSHPVADGRSSSSDTTAPSLESKDVWQALVLTDGQYLDPQQRYQLLTPLEIAKGATEVAIPVIDRHPSQPSRLELSKRPNPEETADLAPPIDRSKIPAIAQPYLSLQEQHPSLPLPVVHDAWEGNGLSILLLQDRTHLPSLAEVCQDDDVPPLQILHWLHEMVNHWAALAPQGYGQSLLESDNLRIDREDYGLCLQRLYGDRPQPPALADLGLFWQTLFEQSQRTQNGNLFLLCRDLQSGEITSLEVLQSRIESVAQTLQTPAASLPVTDVMTMTPALSVESHPSPVLSESVAPEPGVESEERPTIALPVQLTHLEEAGCTMTGRQRDHNEDCFYTQTESRRTEIKKTEDTKERLVEAKGLYILCDGMGGHEGGEVASALAVESLRAYFATHWQDTLPDESSIREAIGLANQAIYDQNQQDARSGSGRMGTTLVLLLLQNHELAIAHVGDSRLYSFSQRRGLQQLTTDHEVGQRDIDRGIDPSTAYARPDAYQLTQALGPRDETSINPDVRFLTISDDMLLLLCSDGLTDNDFLEQHYQDYLEPMVNGLTLDQGVDRLVQAANEFNGHDNITAVAVCIRVRPNFALARHRQPTV